MAPPSDQDFQLEVIDRLSRIEEKVESVSSRVGEHDVEIKPLRKHVNMMAGGMALIALLGALLAVVRTGKDVFVQEASARSTSSERPRP